MKNLEKNDENTLKDCIFTALILLMEQKDYHSITITDIAKKAGVSRMTYYRTYSSKEDILIQYFNKVSQELFMEIQQFPDITPDQLICHFFYFFQEKGSLILNLKKANLFELMMNTFIFNLKNLYTDMLYQQLPDTSIDYHLHYHIGGLFHALLYWIESGQKESPEEMAMLITSFLTV